MYTAYFYMRSGNVISFDCDDFSMTKKSDGSISKWEAEGVRVQCLSINIEDVEAVKVVKK